MDHPDPTPKFVTKLVHMLEQKKSGSREKFVPNKIKPKVKAKSPSETEPVTPPVTPPPGASDTGGGLKKRYDEALTQLPSLYKSVKALSLEESYDLTQRDNKKLQQDSQRNQENLRERLELNKQVRLKSKAQMREVLKSYDESKNVLKTDNTNS